MIITMKKFFLSAAALVMTAASFFAIGQVAELPADPAVRKGHLENGLTYYIRHNALPEGRAEFYLATNVGAIQETPDQDGLAHFLEHMCFNGTKNFPGKGILDYLQSIGASFGGNVNASTGVEQTVYMLNNIPLLRESVIDTCILIMHDYAHYVTNDPKEIDDERGVILEEKRYRDGAEWRLYMKSLPYIYGDNKYATCSVIGTDEQLKTFKPESLHNFYSTWYHPDMQALIVVGDVDVDYVEARIKDIFGQIPAAVNPKAKDIIKIEEFDEPRVAILTDPEQTDLGIEVLWESETLPEQYNNTSIGLMTDILKNFITTIINERLSDLEAKPDCPFINANVYFEDLCETNEAFTANVKFSEGKALEAFNALMLEIEKVRRFGFTDDELERAKQEILSQYETYANKADTRKNGQLIFALISNFFDNTYYMAPQQMYEYAKQILESGAIQMAVGQTLPQLVAEKNNVILYKAPEKEGLSHPSEQQLLDIFKSVKDAEIAVAEGEKIEKEFLDASKIKAGKVVSSAEGIYGSTEWTLSNGIKVILYPSQLEKDRISALLVKDGGLSLVPVEDLYSLNSSIVGLFRQNSGISRFPATVCSKMLSGKQVSSSFNIGGIRHSINSSSTRKDLETAFQMMYLMVTDPRFDQDEYNKGIKTLEAYLQNVKNQPEYKFQQEVSKTIFENKERNIMLDEASLAKANMETLEKYYRMMFEDMAGATLYIAGDFELETIKPLVETYFASLPAEKEATKWIDHKNYIKQGDVLNEFTAVMNTPQVTVCSLYSADLEASYENEAAAKAVSYVLDLRYTKSLREEEGGTYGVGVSAEVQKEPKEFGLMEIYFNCNPDAADKLRDIVVKQFSDLAENGPDEEEFTKTLSNLKKNIPERRVNNSYWLGCIEEHERFGKDRDKGFEAAVNALTPEAVKAMAGILLKSGNHIELVMRPQL